MDYAGGKKAGKESQPNWKKENMQKPGTKPEMKGPKVFVSGLPFGCTEKEVYETFQDCGEITEVKLNIFKDRGFGKKKKCNGQAYVTFATREHAQAAVTVSGTDSTFLPLAI